MKQVKLIVTGLLIAGLTGIYSCKKNKDEEATVTDDGQVSAVDEADVSSESNEAVDDANVAFTNAGSANGRISGGGVVIGATITKDSAAKKVTIAFDGTTLVKGFKTRKGVITVQLTKGDKWKDPGAEMTITFENFAVTKLTADNDVKTRTYNGSHVITNVSGGLAASMVDGQTVIHTIAGSMKIIFTQGYERTWTVSRKVTYTQENGSKTIQIESNSSDNKVITGVNRNGKDFSVAITSPLIIKQACDYRKPISGVKVHNYAKVITVTFGVTTTGEVVGMGKDCDDYYGYKVNWTSPKGLEREAVIKY